MGMEGQFATSLELQNYRWQVKHHVASIPDFFEIFFQVCVYGPRKATVSSAKVGQCDYESPFTGDRTMVDEFNQVG